jgi:hypothetical protein
MNIKPYPGIVYDFSANYFQKRKKGIAKLKKELEVLTENYKKKVNGK